MNRYPCVFNRWVNSLQLDALILKISVRLFLYLKINKKFRKNLYTSRAVYCIIVIMKIQKIHLDD